MHLDPVLSPLHHLGIACSNLAETISYLSPLLAIRYSGTGKHSDPTFCPKSGTCVHFGPLMPNSGLQQMAKRPINSTHRDKVANLPDCQWDLPICARVRHLCF
jgi:hypothetical protein